MVVGGKREREGKRPLKGTREGVGRTTA